jgi:hypothetical protein
MLMFNSAKIGVFSELTKFLANYFRFSLNFNTF